MTPESEFGVANARRTPAAIANSIGRHGEDGKRVGIETEPFTLRLAHGLRSSGLVVNCLDARRAGATISFLPKCKHCKRDTHSYQECGKWDTPRLGNKFIRQQPTENQATTDKSDIN